MAGQVEVEEVEKRVGSGPSSGAVFQLFLESQPRADKTKMLSKLNAVSMHTAGEIIQCRGNLCGWRSSSVRIYPLLIEKYVCNSDQSCGKDSKSHVTTTHISFELPN